MLTTQEGGPFLWSRLSAFQRPCGRRRPFVTCPELAQLEEGADVPHCPRRCLWDRGGHRRVSPRDWLFMDKGC